MSKPQHWVRTVLIASAIPSLGALLVAFARLSSWASDRDWTLNASTWGNYAEWAVAVATILLAFVAVGQDWIRSWWSKPELDVTTTGMPPDCALVPVLNSVTGAYVGNSVFLRVRVTNVGGATAKYVEVYADALYKINEDSGESTLVSAFPMMNLKWANTPGDIYIRRLAPDLKRHCDVCHVIDPGARTGTADDSPRLGLTKAQTSMAFDLQTSPNHKEHIRGPGTYVLEIQVAAENRRPIRRRLEIRLDGSWSPEETTMLESHARIRVLPA
jgi:hypothetical protein